MADLPNIVDELEALGQLLVEQFNQYVSINELSFVVDEEGDIPMLRFSYPAYAEYIDQGRRAGSAMPPTTAIQEWATTRGIPNDLNTAFAIAVAIGRDGIPARPFIEMTLDQALDLYEDLIADAAVLDLDSMLEEFIEQNNLD